MTEYEVNQICREYGFERQKFARFLTDFFAMPYAELPPWPEDPVDIELEQIARQVGLPAFVLRKAQEEGAVSEPMTAGDLDALRCIKALFGRNWFIRAQLTKCRQSERQRLIQRPELEPWERWAYTTFIEHKMRKEPGEQTEKSGNRLPLIYMIKTIEETFGVPPTEVVKSRLLKIRKMATNDHYAAKKKGVDPKAMIRRRSVDLVDPAK